MAETSTPVIVQTDAGAITHQDATTFYVDERGHNLIIENGATVIAIHRYWNRVYFASEVKE